MILLVEVATKTGEKAETPSCWWAMKAASTSALDLVPAK